MQTIIPDSAKTESCENYFSKLHCFGELKHIIALSDPDCYDQFWDHINVLINDGLDIVCENNVYLFREELQAYLDTNPKPYNTMWDN